MIRTRYARTWLVAAGAAALLASCGRGHADKDAPKPGAPAQTPQVQAPAVPTTTLAAKVENKSFRDWETVCDNGGACTAVAPAVDDGDGWLTIRMAPETAAVPEILLGLWVDDDAKVGGSVPVTLTIDGRSFRTERVADANLPTARVIPADAMGAVRALAAGRAATAKAGRTSVVLSLSGAAAATLWIDERQDRLDTPNALNRVGQRAAAVQGPAVPAVTLAPAVTQGSLAAEGQTLPKSIEILPDVRECRLGSSDGGDVMAAKLGPQQELWGVPCGSGAYNFTTQLYVTGPNGQRPTAVRLPQADGTTTNEVVNGYYNPQTRTLQAFAKARGIGDCGTAQTWAWTGRGFVLVEEQTMTKCIGLPSEYWPISWRAKVE